MIVVTTASGRKYEIDTAERKFRTVGDQALHVDGVAVNQDPNNEWTTYRWLDVDDKARLHIIEPEGEWRVSTRVVEGLGELVDALDAEVTA
jgi:hypothetical protein